MQKRDACSGDGVLVAELSDSVITDAQNRTGYISSGYQFQFDNPPQAGALYTAGFTRCDNGSLALGGSAVFYQCRSGDFYNLYDRWLAEQCSPIHILVMPCDGEANNDLEPDDDTVIIGTSTLATTVVIPLSDGQPQVVSTATVVNICQIDDGTARLPRMFGPVFPLTLRHRPNPGPHNPVPGTRGQHPVAACVAVPGRPGPGHASRVRAAAVDGADGHGRIGDVISPSHRL